MRPAAGYSTGQAIQAIKEVAAETLPRGYGIGWAGLSYDEARKGNEAIYIFLIVVAFVYLVLVGQYESFILPLAVILSLPVGLFGSFLFLQAMGLANDVYAQIGLVMLVGLLGKNAILIVEFAVQRRREGVSLKEAAIEGGKLRFRPIQMTSFAFIAGLIPLVVATGAGAIGNRTIGTTGVGGMLVGTVIGVLVIPGLYYLFGQLADGRKLLQDETDEPLSEILEHDTVAGERPRARRRGIERPAARRARSAARRVPSAIVAPLIRAGRRRGDGEATALDASAPVSHFDLDDSSRFGLARTLESASPDVPCESSLPAIRPRGPRRSAISDPLTRLNPRADRSGCPPRSGRPPRLPRTAGRGPARAVKIPRTSADEPTFARASLTDETDEAYARSSNAKHGKHAVARAIACSILLRPAGLRHPSVSVQTGGETPQGRPPAGELQRSDQPGELGSSSGSKSFSTIRCFEPDRPGTGRQSGAEDPEEDVQIASNEILARSGAYLPFVTLGASAGLDKASHFTLEGAAERRPRIPPRAGSFPTRCRISWSASTSPGSWTSGGSCGMPGTRPAQRYLAAIERRNYFVTRLVAEIAENYYGLMALDKRLENLDQIIELQEQSLEVAKARKEAARGTELAVQRFQAEVRKNQSEKLIVNQEIIEAENRINFLVGRFPQPVERNVRGILRSEHSRAERGSARAAAPEPARHPPGRARAGGRRARREGRPGQLLPQAGSSTAASATRPSTRNICSSPRKP